MEPSAGFACVSRGEGDQCDWTGASPQFIKPKGQVAREHQQSRQGNPARLRIQQDFQALDSRVEYLLDLVKQHTPSNAATTKPEIVPVTNYHIDDIATQLSRFTLNQAIPQLPADRPLANPNSQISIKEVEEYVEEEERKVKPVAPFTFNIGSGTTSACSNKQQNPIISTSSSHSLSSTTTSPILQGLLGIGKGPSTFEGIMAELPTSNQIKACLEQFEYHRAWMHRILHRPTFWKQVYEQIARNFSYRDEREQAHWLAILFSVCGLGLFNNVVQSPADLVRYQLPTSVQAQRALALRWCRAATSCLEIANFDSAPSLDSVAAMAILAQLPLYTSDGETLGLALDFIGKAIDLAMKLDLHIDPDLHPIHQHSSALEKQNRRRLMVALLCQHYKMGGLLCQERGLRPLEQFSGLELPLDQYDEDFDLTDGHLKVPRAPGSTHTVMTGVRCRFQVSRIWQEIGILFSNASEPPTHEKVLSIHRRLKELEAEWPDSIQTRFNPATCSFTPPFKPLPTSSPGRQVLLIDRLGCFAVFAAAMVRLHRGFLMQVDGAPTEDIKMHREQVYYYGRAMLAIQRAELFPLDNVPIQFFVLSSTISLAVYCLTNNSDEEDDKCEIVVKELEKVKNVLRRCTAMSSILRRTYAVLNFALYKWAKIRNRDTPVDSGRSQKRLKSAGNSSDSGSSHLQEGTTTLPHQSNLTNDTLPTATHNPPNDGTATSPDDSRCMENLLRSLLNDHMWPDAFELNHDLPRHAEPTSMMSNSEGLPGMMTQSFDFSRPFPLHGSSGEQATGPSGTSGHRSDGSSSITYGLPTPPSAPNAILSCMFNDQELQTSPSSITHASATSFPFGPPCFDNNHAVPPPASGFSHEHYLHHDQQQQQQQPLVPSSRNLSASLDAPPDPPHLNRHFIVSNSFPANHVPPAPSAYHLSSQFNLPVNRTTS